MKWPLIDLSNNDESSRVVSNTASPATLSVLTEQVTRLREQLRLLAEAYRGVTQYQGLERQISKLDNRVTELGRVSKTAAERRRALERRVEVLERAAGSDVQQVTCVVNGESQTMTTIRRMLSVRNILIGAGYSPVEDYLLTREREKHVYNDYDQETFLEDGERFTVVFIGATTAA